MVSHLSAVLIVTRDIERVAGFYRDVLEIPLRPEQHPGGGEELHYGCSLAGMHFAVHPVANFAEAPETGIGGVRLAFRTESVEDAGASLRQKGVTFSGPVDFGWSKMLFLRDPDGNYVELVQLSNGR
jgi:catechol-2,3-dioxygenase